MKIFRRRPSVDEFPSSTIQYASTHPAQTDADRTAHQYASMRQMQNELDKIIRNHTHEKGQIERRGSAQMHDIRKQFLEVYKAAERQHRKDLEDCKRKYTEQVMATFGSPPHYM